MIALSLTVVAMLAAAPGAGASVPGNVHLRGTVYAFDDQRPISGATVRVVELPGVAATSGSDGSYDLALPDGTRLTPYVEASGYRGIHLQTFATAGEDLDHVNFQIPSDGTYSALAALLGAEVDASGTIVQCAIVSTFSTVNVRDLSFADFVAYGAHGVAGATASTSPPLPGPVYFNSSVVPDPSLSESSVDGGVIWTEVPAGVYRVSASHPTTRFADLVATCKPGRLVNANPPWGLRELRADEVNDESVSGSLAAARVKRAHGERRLRIRTVADEYVAVAAAVRKRGRELASTATSGAGAYAPGPRRLSLALPRKPRNGRVTLEVELTDAVGNERTETKRLRLRERG